MSRVRPLDQNAVFGAAPDRTNQKPVTHDIDIDDQMGGQS